jgi:hypothetical protein
LDDNEKTIEALKDAVAISNNRTTVAFWFAAFAIVAAVVISVLG